MAQLDREHVMFTLFLRLLVVGSALLLVLIWY